MKKWGTFVLCAVLITGLVSRTIHLVSAQEEIQADETQVEESSPQDSTEPNSEVEEYPEESNKDGEEQEAAGEQPEQSESGSQETSEESESAPSQSLPDESDSEGESLPVAETDESGENQTEEETPEVIEGETPEVIEGEIPKEIPEVIPTEIPKETPVQKENESNQDVVEAMQAAHDSLNEHIDYIANLLNMADDYTLIEGEDNFCEALAIYAIKHEQTEDYPYGIEITGEEDSTELQSIYWRLNAVNGAKTEGDSVIRVTQLSAVKVYNLSDSQRDVFKKLNSIENREIVNGLFQE